MRFASITPVPVFFLSIACATAPPAELTPLVLGQQHAVEYSAELLSGPGGLKRELSQAALSSSAAQGELTLHLRCRQLSLTEPEARELGLLAVGGWTVPRAEADRFLARAEWRQRPVSTLLTVHPRQAAAVTLINERAYVRSYSVTVAETSLLADPVVDVLQEGSLILARAEPLEDGSVALELTLHLSDLQGLEPVEVRVPGGFTPVTLQQPVVSQQRLATSAHLGPDESLLLVALEPAGEGRLLLCVEAVPGRVPGGGAQLGRPATLDASTPQALEEALGDGR